MMVMGIQATFADAPKSKYADRWVYNMSNLLVDENANRLPR